MTTTALRQRVKNYIDTADEKTLKIINAIMEVENSYDLADDYPEYVQEAIRVGKQELKEGKGISHEEVMRSLRNEL